MDYTSQKSNSFALDTPQNNSKSYPLILSLFKDFKYFLNQYYLQSIEMIVYERVMLQRVQVDAGHLPFRVVITYSRL